MNKKLMEEGKPFYDVWMYEVSDGIQSVATAFAERICVEAAIAKIASCEHAGVKQILE